MKKLFFLLVALSIAQLVFAQKKTSGPKNAPTKYTAYLFTYFTGNKKDEEAIRFAISNDGYYYTALNNNQSVIASEKISKTGGVRDPHILRGADGKTFYIGCTAFCRIAGRNGARS